MQTARSRAPGTAVLIPRYDEALTIVDAVAAFRAELPEADICVFALMRRDSEVGGPE